MIHSKTSDSLRLKNLVMSISYIVDTYRRFTTAQMATLRSYMFHWVPWDRDHMCDQEFRTAAFTLKLLGASIKFPIDTCWLSVWRLNNWWETWTISLNLDSYVATFFWLKSYKSIISPKLRNSNSKNKIQLPYTFHLPWC